MTDQWGLSVDRRAESAYHQYSALERSWIDEASQSQADLTADGVAQLMIDDEGVSVRIPSLKRPFTWSFCEGRVNYRARRGAETLCRVTGAHLGGDFHIVDATGGLGREAYLLASSGASVTSIERSLPLYLLSRAALWDAAAQFQLLWGESPHVWSGLSADLSADVIYLDPMFPKRMKRAAVGKEAQVLQAFAPPPSEGEERALLEWALDTAVYRVVVKRPLKAPPLHGVAPTSAVRGRAVRFDLYGKRKLPSALTR